MDRRPENDVADLVRQDASERTAYVRRRHERLSQHSYQLLRHQRVEHRLGRTVIDVDRHVLNRGIADACPAKRQGEPIAISVRAHEGKVRLVVKDHGIGIPPEMHERIFLPFERAVAVRHYGGLGLGLFIARTVVDDLGGKISLESSPKAGSSFTVELPQGRSP
jgi:signal transduction histidine kinase